MGALNTRELALLIWIVLAILYLALSEKRRDLKEPLKALIRAFFTRHIVSVFTLMTIYVCFVVYVFERFGLWDWSQLKNTVFWYFVVAALFLFKIEKIKNDPHFLKSAVLDNVKLLGIIEFLTGVYTFHLLIELSLTPILFILSAMIAVAVTKPEYKNVEKLLNRILVFVGLCILTATFYFMFADINKVANKDSLQDFVTPPLLTTAYIPFITFMVVYTAYQNIFVGMRFSIKSTSVRIYAKLAALVVFNGRILLLERWARNIAQRNITSLSGVNQSIRQILRMAATERNPPIVDISDGWSPYAAKDYLITEGIKTRDYHPVDPSDGLEWFCASDLVEFGGGLLKNNIAYYLNGDEKAVTSLKLKLNVNTLEYAPEAHARLLYLSAILVHSAIGLELDGILRDAIVNGYDSTVEVPGYKIITSKHVWPNHKLNGYDLGLTIYASNECLQPTAQRAVGAISEA